MTQLFSFFFRDIIGQKVITPDGTVLGRLRDILTDSSSMRPIVIGAQVQTQKGLQTLYFKGCKLAHPKGRSALIVDNATFQGDTPSSSIWLSEQMLNRQVVDIDNKQIVRVNDLRIAILSTGVFVVAIDASAKGRLRRYGLEMLVERIWGFFGASIPARMILWENIETIGQVAQSEAEPVKGVSALERFHPSDVADIIEDLDPKAQVQVFSAMNMERAADVLEEIESDTRESLLQSLSPEKMADVLERMPADEVADILDEVNGQTAEELLREMDDEASDEVRDLMHYGSEEVGALMSTDFYHFKEKDTVGTVLDKLRREKPDSDVIYDLFIVTESGALAAVVTLRDIAVTDPDVTLEQIMNRDVVFVRDTDSADKLRHLIAKYNLLSIPVVNTEKVLVGVAIINDVLQDLLKPKRKK